MLVSFSSLVCLLYVNELLCASSLCLLALCVSALCPCTSLFEWLICAGQVVLCVYQPVCFVSICISIIIRFVSIRSIVCLLLVYSISWFKCLILYINSFACLCTGLPFRFVSISSVVLCLRARLGLIVSLFLRQSSSSICVDCVMSVMWCP